MSAFGDVETTDPHEIWAGVLGRVVQGQGITLAVIELDANGMVPEHSHANEQLGVLISGSLTFRIGDETQELRPGSTWVIPADVPHSVDAGPDGAFLIELFAPPRDDWAGLDRLAPSPPSGF